jgi:hypothetical protein
MKAVDARAHLLPNSAYKAVFFYYIFFTSLLSVFFLVDARVY